jgi:hypothetical protein
LKPHHASARGVGAKLFRANVRGNAGTGLTFQFRFDLVRDLCRPAGRVVRMVLHPRQLAVQHLAHDLARLGRAEPEARESLRS